MDGKGRVKLEYLHNEQRRISLWETVKGSTLETVFDCNGSILLQRLTKLNGDSLKSRIHEVAVQENISSMEEREYDPIELDRACPKCGDHALQRQVEAFASRGEFPVMPLYHCKSCSSKSYHLTNEYLEYLVDSNREFFTDAETTDLAKDKGEFMKQLKDYIIRIFASKQVMCIE